jgi:hypothetical protein
VQLDDGLLVEGPLHPGEILATTVERLDEAAAERRVHRRNELGPGRSVRALELVKAPLEAPTRAVRSNR